RRPRRPGVRRAGHDRGRAAALPAPADVRGDHAALAARASRARAALGRRRDRLGPRHASPAHAPRGGLAPGRDPRGGVPGERPHGTPPGALPRPRRRPRPVGPAAVPGPLRLLGLADHAAVMDLAEAVRTRRTHKAFGAEPVARAELDALFELARWAPNHNLTNPWRFRVLGPRALAALKDAAGADAAGKLDRAPTLVAVTARRTGEPVQDREDE